MKPEDIDLETTVGELNDAFERGDFTIADWARQRPRLDALRAERAAGILKAIEAVKPHVRPRSASRTWKCKFVIGWDKSRFYLVECGRRSWHVDPETFAVKRVH